MHGTTNIIYTEYFSICRASDYTDVTEVRNSLALPSYFDFHYLMNLSHIIIQRFFVKHKVKETIKLTTDAAWL